MLDKLRKLFCKHDWEREVIRGGFLVVDGWLVNPVQYRCRKCGKIITEEEYKRRNGGKHLDAPPCTTCPAHPKLESTSKLLESNGDRFRALTDERLVNLFFLIYRCTVGWCGEINRLWCDGKGCGVDEFGENTCDDERRRACILRWLRAPVGEEQWADL